MPSPTILVFLTCIIGAGGLDAKVNRSLWVKLKCQPVIIHGFIQSGFTLSILGASSIVLQLFGSSIREEGTYIADVVASDRLFGQFLD